MICMVYDVQIVIHHQLTHPLPGTLSKSGGGAFIISHRCRIYKLPNIRMGEGCKIKN